MKTDKTGLIGGETGTRFLSVMELAVLLRVGRATAYALCRRPGFPALRVGGLIRIPAAALNEWLRAQQAKESNVVSRAGNDGD